MAADFLYWTWTLQQHPSTAVFASDEIICFHLHLSLVIGRSVILLLHKNIQQLQIFKIEDSLTITSFPPKQSTISCGLLDFEQMLLIQKENSTTKIGCVKMFDFIFTKSQT